MHNACIQVKGWLSVRFIQIQVHEWIQRQLRYPQPNAIPPGYHLNKCANRMHLNDTYTQLYSICMERLYSCHNLDAMVRYIFDFRFRSVGEIINRCYQHSNMVNICFCGIQLFSFFFNESICLFLFRLWILYFSTWLQREIKTFLFHGIRLRADVHR